MARTYAEESEKIDRPRRQVEAGEITLRVAEVHPPERAADARRIVGEFEFPQQAGRGMAGSAPREGQADVR
jgi:hypothetical protein